MPLLRALNTLIVLPARLWRHPGGKALYLVAIGCAAIRAGWYFTALVTLWLATMVYIFTA